MQEGDHRIDNGDRIYFRKNKVKQKQKESESDVLKQPIQNYHLATKSSRGASKCTDTSLPAEKFDELLNNIDNQTKTLDKLRQTYHVETIDSSAYDDKCLFDFAHQTLRPSQPVESVGSIERKQLLDNYLKHRISGATGECGCRFHLLDAPYQSSSDELSECYPKNDNIHDLDHKTVAGNDNNNKTNVIAIHSSESFQASKSEQGYDSLFINIEAGKRDVDKLADEIDSNRIVRAGENSSSLLIGDLYIEQACNIECNRNNCSHNKDTLYKEDVSPGRSPSRKGFICCNSPRLTKTISSRYSEEDDFIPDTSHAIDRVIEYSIASDSRPSSAPTNKESYDYLDYLNAEVDGRLNLSTNQILLDCSLTYEPSQSNIEYDSISHLSSISLSDFDSTEAGLDVRAFVHQRSASARELRNLSHSEANLLFALRTSERCFKGGYNLDEQDTPKAISKSWHNFEFSSNHKMGFDVEDDKDEQNSGTSSPLNNGTEITDNDDRTTGRGHKRNNLITDKTATSHYYEQIDYKDTQQQGQHYSSREARDRSEEPQDFIEHPSQDLHKDAAQSNMRAAKDIVKMSAPSLSSLQYLPGQMDLTTKRKMNAKRSKSNNSADKSVTKTNIDDDVDKRHKSKNIARQPTSDSMNDVRREGSFLHRLCLCNCISQSHQCTEQNQPSLTKSKNISASGAKRASSSDKISSVLPLRSRPMKMSAKISNSNEELSANKQTKEISHDFKMGRLGNDKQLKLRKPSASSKSRRQDSDYEQQSSALISKAKEEYYEQSNKQRVASSGKNPLTKANQQRAPSDLGSDGDLAASLSHDLDFSQTNCSSSPSRPRSTLSATLTDEANSISPTTNDLYPTECYPNTNTITSTTTSNKKIHKSKGSYKRFLTPSRLFNSQASSLDDPQEINESLPDSGIHQSFLSRSLSRLSGRKRSKRKPAQNYIQPSNQDRSTSDCVSPTISISNTSQTNESLKGSLNSLDISVDLPHSLPANIDQSSHLTTGRTRSRLLEAPGIVLNKVEILNNQANDLNECSSEMTRSSRLYHHYNDSSSYQGPSRQASEHSYDPINENFNHQGPFSLPASPDPQRRNVSPRLSHSPVPFRSPATESTKIEDGLKVCSTEHFEKHIDNIKENQVEAQKRLFKTWINHFCPNLIRHDLIEELQDGIKLIGLLASLTHDKQLFNQYDKLNQDKQSYVNRLVVTPSSRLKHLSNVSIAINYLRKTLGMKLVNLNPMDIVSGKSNVILGLCWNIILYFQLEQNYLRYSDTSSIHSSDLSTSRLSNSLTNEDRASKVVRGASSLMEEYTTRDLVTAKNRLLDHINKRFNLKLTKMTSTLIDGDILLVIIKHLLPDQSIDLKHNLALPWEAMQDEAKLDHCFDMANKYLNVPKLFSASDLKQQTIGGNNSKPLLVYLSMLLNSNPNNCSTEQMIELRQLDKSLLIDYQNDQSGIEQHTSMTLETKLEKFLNEIDTQNKFELDKLQSTMEKIQMIDGLIAKENANKDLNESVISRLERLKDDAKQVDSLINWIDQADKLFDTNQKSSADLANAIEEYQNFFSSDNLPKVTVPLCPTLERQYRECLATARQKVLSMEQTMKNWINYEQARQELKTWLLDAETKLINSLRPIHSNSGGESLEPIEQHMNRLDDLINYFELEQNDLEDLVDCESLASDGVSLTSTTSLLNKSLSSSLISIGSNSSRLSTLTSSKSASYHRLFDDFELKCRLLAAMLDPEQRDALLFGVKELKSRLKYITEHRVPQVINELRLDISRYEMAIEEQDEEDDIIEKEECVPINSALIDDIVEDDHIELNGTTPDVKPATSDMNTTAAQGSKKLRHKNKNKKPKAKLDRKKNKTKTGSTNDVIKTSKDDDHDVSIFSAFWKRLVRSSKVSISLNIVLLLCLAGLCVVPLMNKDACCELSQTPIPVERLSITQKPT